MMTFPQGELEEGYSARCSQAFKEEMGRSGKAMDLATSLCGSGGPKKEI
jgi:hypothetical protein